MFRSLSELTLHIIVRFPTGDPFASLKAPVIGVCQDDFYKHVVMSCQVEPGDVETEEWEHSPGNTRE